jgi:plasmid maintenance system antidote protein VapI
MASPISVKALLTWLGPENGGNAETWLRMQIDYDLWQSNKSRPLRKVKRVVPEAA